MLSQELTELINFIEQRLSTAPGEHNNPTHTVNSKGRNTKKAVPELSLSSMKPTFSLFDVAANLRFVGSIHVRGRAFVFRFC